MAKADERLAVLEVKHDGLERDIVELKGSIDNLRKVVEDLTAVINKGKGAYAVSVVVASFIGAGIAKLIGRFFS